MAIREPAVSRRTLFFSAGLIWLIGGGVLAWRTVEVMPTGHSLWPIYMGAALGVIKFILAFRRIGERNIRRIRELAPHKDKICVFAFQSWASYLLVIVMVGLGLLLRLFNTPPVALALIYAMIAMGLGLGSIIYFRALWESRPADESELP